MRPRDSKGRYIKVSSQNIFDNSGGKTPPPTNHRDKYSYKKTKGDEHKKL